MMKIVRKLLLIFSIVRVSFLERIYGIDFIVSTLQNSDHTLAPRLLRRYGATLGKGVGFKGGLIIDNATGDEDATGDFSNIVIGNNCYIGRGVFLDLPDFIILEEEVILSAGVKILTHQDCGDRAMAKWYPRKRAGVKLGAGTWIGANAVILAGVELGSFCVVGAGAVVTKSFPSYSVLAGVPAKLIKTLSE